MKISDVKNLRTGDEVRWIDPDDDECSKTVIIGSIEYKNGIVSIIGKDGSHLECYPRELRLCCEIK